MATRPAIFKALIRTHHITSRKKITKLRQAAASNSVYALLRSGAPPGIMYVEGSEAGVASWLATVQKLRYKDYQLAARPAALEAIDRVDRGKLIEEGVDEVGSVKEFAERMRHRGVFEWWRAAMGYTHERPD